MLKKVYFAIAEHKWIPKESIKKRRALYKGIVEKSIGEFEDISNIEDCFSTETPLDVKQKSLYEFSNMLEEMSKADLVVFDNGLIKHQNWKYKIIKFVCIKLDVPYMVIPTC